MTAGEIGAATARLLFEAGAIQVSRDRPFVLAAGWASPVYVDCRLLIGEPRLWREAVRLAAVLPAPLKRKPERMNRYPAIILGRMRQMGW